VQVALVAVLKITVELTDFQATLVMDLQHLPHCHCAQVAEKVVQHAAGMQLAVTIIVLVTFADRHVVLTMQFAEFKDLLTVVGVVMTLGHIFQPVQLLVLA
jgi:hypothetical protein